MNGRTTVLAGAGLGMSVLCYVIGFAYATLRIESFEASGAAHRALIARALSSPAL